VSKKSNNKTKERLKLKLDAPERSGGKKADQRKGKGGGKGRGKQGGQRASCKGTISLTRHGEIKHGDVVERNYKKAKAAFSKRKRVRGTNEGGRIRKR